MQFLNYFLLSIAVFLGIVLGIILIKIAPEEQKPLSKYLIFAKRILLILLFIFLAFFYIFDKMSLLLVMTILIPCLFLEFKSEDNLRKMAEAYVLFAILFFLSSPNPNLLAITSTLIFLYGTVFSSIMPRKNFIKVIFSGSTFLLISNLLFLLNYHFSFRI